MNINYIFYTGNNNRILDIVIKLNKLLNSEAFLTTLKNIDRFEYSSTGGRYVSGQNIVEIFQNPPAIAELVFYKGFFLSKALAYVDGKNPKRINFNARKINSPDNVIAGILAHELIHVFDNFHKYNFGHGDNNPYGKINSAPYLIGEIVGKLWR